MEAARADHQISRARFACAPWADAADPQDRDEYATLSAGARRLSARHLRLCRAAENVDLDVLSNDHDPTNHMP